MSAYKETKYSHTYSVGISISWSIVGSVVSRPQFIDETSRKVFQSTRVTPHNLCSFHKACISITLYTRIPVLNYVNGLQPTIPLTDTCPFNVQRSKTSK